MMIDEVEEVNLRNNFVSSSRDTDLETRVNALLAQLAAGSAFIEGWHLGGSGFGPNFRVTVEWVTAGQGANAIAAGSCRFFFYSAASDIAMVANRAAAEARLAAYAAANPDMDTFVVDSQLAGGSQGLTQMGMLVAALRTP